jgi:hypothetical protein
MLSVATGRVRASERQRPSHPRTATPRSLLEQDTHPWRKHMPARFAFS